MSAQAEIEKSETARKLEAHERRIADLETQLAGLREAFVQLGGHLSQMIGLMRTVANGGKTN